jgi:hypothetical protein
MAKTEATVEELVSMIERGKLRLPEMQRRYVWRSTGGRFRFHATPAIWVVDSSGKSSALPV